ncbi:hypothetical protein CAI21_22475 [Alkalilimnicola ehrlichii]|uniref:Protein kinase domain-containing protein n=2 Tax=Alkalilimnicola ehrlichii TaxID=351052 RepID=A0A3E0WEX2_9GAMM|nr:hypothetical protein CAI21_22475 [Alkalilimnicola ehrlichii]RFA31083.1 hypothetical protein CAL65_22605 [Alkalilimnicola ehrlichii]
MLSAPPKSQSVFAGKQRHETFCWPDALILEANTRTPTGYSKPRIYRRHYRSLGEELQYLSKLNYRERTAERVIDNAIALIDAVEALHHARHRIIALAPQSILFRRDHNGLICFADCMNFSLGTARRGRSAATGTPLPEYSHPKALWGSDTPETLQEHQDNYAVAVIIFRLLNKGIHPYDGVMADGSPSPPLTERVINKLYAYSPSEHPQVRPLKMSLHRRWPHTLHKLFERAFIANEPPTLTDWRKELVALREIGSLHEAEDRLNKEQAADAEAARRFKDTAFVRAKQCAGALVVLSMLALLASLIYELFGPASRPGKLFDTFLMGAGVAGGLYLLLFESVGATFFMRTLTKKSHYVALYAIPCTAIPAAWAITVLLFLR